MTRGRAAPRDWQVQLLVRSRGVIATVLTIIGVLVAIGARSVSLRWYALALLVGALVVWFGARERHGWQTRAWAIVGPLSVAAIGCLPIAGFMPGPVLGIAIALTLAILLLGRREMFWLLAAAMLTAGGIIVAIAIGGWQGPPQADSDVADPRVWIRSMLVAATLCGALAISIRLLVGTIERTTEHRESAVRERERALALAEEQARERHRAEQAHREAEAVAIESQKLDAVGQLAAGVAHDFNNALQVIRGWNEIIAADDSPEIRKAATTAIADAGRQAAELSSRLLVFGRKELRTPRPLLLDEIVEAAMATLASIVPASVELRVDVEPDLAVFADRTQLQQLLYNLVLNARDAVEPDGEIAVRLRGAATAEGIGAEVPDEAPHGLGWAVIEVVDDGAGMDAVTRRRALEPFFTTKGVGKGSGLGLSAVFGIVRQSGGRIDLASERGTGTRVTVALPRIATPVADVPPPELPPTGREPRAASVLLVEDNPGARRVVVRLLEGAGYTVHDVPDGDAALRRLRAPGGDRYDALCIDGIFPGASLATVIAAYRARTGNGRVLVCSGYPPDELPALIDNEGVRLLRKPFGAARLIAEVAALLESDPIMDRSPRPARRDRR